MSLTIKQNIKKDLNIRFTSYEKSLGNTYSWLIKNPKYLSYFSLRAERFILYNLPVPDYQKILWKIIDYLNYQYKKLKNKLRRVDWIRKNIHRLKNIMVTRLSLK